MAKQTTSQKKTKENYRPQVRKLPEVRLQSEIKQEDIDVWLEKYRKDRNYPGVQEHFAHLTVLYWQGRRPAQDYIQMFADI